MSAPERIYLQWEEFERDAVTWCGDQINESDVEYVRAGRVAELESVFGHYHVAGDPEIDKCAECGLDIRDSIHTRGVVR